MLVMCFYNTRWQLAAYWRTFYSSLCSNDLVVPLTNVKAITQSRFCAHYACTFDITTSLLMSRGSSWNAQTLEDVAKAWIAATCHHIVRIDQTMGRFATTFQSAFMSRAAEDLVVNKRYTLRSAKSVKFWFDTISTETQKFQKPLHIVVSCNPAGTKDGQVLFMTIAIHVGRIDKISYD